MSNTRTEETNTVFYSDVAWFFNTFSLNMYVSMPYTGSARRNTVFIFLWLRHTNTIQHAGNRPPPVSDLFCPFPPARHFVDASDVAFAHAEALSREDAADIPLGDSAKEGANMCIYIYIYI